MAAFLVSSESMKPRFYLLGKQTRSLLLEEELSEIIWELADQGYSFGFVKRPFYTNSRQFSLLEVSGTILRGRTARG